MDSQEIRQKFLKFFADRGHKIVPSSSLMPDDPSVLLTSAGMQQFKKYYTGEADPLRDFGVKNTVSVQKSFRTSDIDEVGDESHLTFFEMLGNFSFGGYFKKEAIEYAYEFITKEMGLKISYVTIFKGVGNVPKDEESKQIWSGLGIKDIREEGMEDVFWGPTGSSGPCGPTTEIYCRNAEGKDVEIWNIVFNEFFCNGSREQLLKGNADLKPLHEKGIDTGMGLERLAMIAQKKKNIFETDLFDGIIKKLGSEGSRSQRIVADHLRGIVFLIGDGVVPSNKEQGYILRRLLRRVGPYFWEWWSVHLQRFTDGSLIPRMATPQSIAELVIDQYGAVEQYNYLKDKKKMILSTIEDEYGRFRESYRKGSKILEQLVVQAKERNADMLLGEDIFDLVTTYGFSLEWIKDIAKKSGLNIDLTSYEAEFKKHQEISRAGVEKKFGGHGLILDTGELKAGSEEELKIVTRLHTATHLLNAALHQVLGDEVSQRGSDITTERARYDFAFSRKMTPEEIKKTEDLVNEAIAKDYPVQEQEMPLEEAKKSGAMFFYKGHYPEKVKVYTIGDEKETISKELCGGPHVTRTGEIGKFKIIKEESSSAGIRRIRAVISK